MYRTNTCGELRITNLNQEVTLAGWVQKARKFGGMIFVDLRDRYGITQLVFNQETNFDLCEQAAKLGREWVVQTKGRVAERSNKNPNIPTGDIEIIASELHILNPSETPPFTIEDESDGGDDLRMKYRYLDLRRNPVRANLELRHRMAFATRSYLNENKFLEVETPVLIGSTPEGARDFVVPSRMNPGEFYALPQSPQTLKQLLMVSGFDRYFQIVKCFRDEDLRADRQPEFTQIDCEMSFIEQEDILNVFEGLTKYLFKTIRGVDLPDFPRMTYADAMRLYGSDKPDTRFGMQLVELKKLVEDLNTSSEAAPDDLETLKFPLFHEAEYIGGICAKGCANYSRKQLDELIDFVKRPQIGAKGLVYIKCEQAQPNNPVLTYKSSIEKYYSRQNLEKTAEAMQAEAGDLILILAGETEKTQKQLNELRLEMGSRLGLRDKKKYNCLWVVDFPLLEYDEELKRYFAKHHPFTSPKPEDIPMLDTNPGAVRANAYDMVINGVEIGGGSIRIYNSELQKKMFSVLGFSEEQAQAQFGFLMNAFKYGAPPHGGIAFGLDRFVSIFAGLDSIRDCIAFPKNNSGRDVMLDAPATIASEQLDELHLKIESQKKKS